MVSSPKPPDPYKQAQAQQGAEMSAAQASAIINNPNQVNPYGTQTNKVIGWETVYDAKGKAMKVPRYQTTTTLSKEQQGLLNLSNQAQTNLGQLGVSQSNKLKGLLGTNLDTRGLSPWQTYGKAPTLATGYGSGGSVASGFGNAGNIQTGIKGAGSGIQKSIGDGGAIRQDQGKTDRTAIERAMMDRYNRDASSQTRAEDAQLAARGMSPGSKQYSNVDEDRDRARTDAVNQAYLASGAESRAAQEAYNAAQAQRFGQGATQGQFANTAQQQMFGQNEANAQFGNAAQQQQFQEMLARAGFGNAAQAQRNQQNAQAAGFGNAAKQQNYGNSVQWADLMNNLRGAQLGERTNLRNQPLNEISALMSGSQVTAPQFQPFSRQGVNAAPIGQYIGQNYSNQANAAAQTNQGIFGLGGSIFGALGGGWNPMSMFG